MEYPCVRMALARLCQTQTMARAGVRQAVTRVVGIIGYPGVVALDVVGPFDAFAIAGQLAAGVKPAYRCLLICPRDEPIVTDSGLRFVPDYALAHAPAQLDTVIVAGGDGARDPTISAPISAWLKGRAPRCRRIASVCIGIYALAPTGLLDGRRVATHWRFAQDVARRFPALRVDADAIFVESGPFWTSAGVTAGIDLALAMIEADHGPELALTVAREMVVYLKRAGGQAQYSAPLKFQTAARNRLSELIAWMSAHLAEDLSVAVLAARSCVTPRHLTRKFIKAFGLPPGRVAELLRLDEACRHLLTTQSSITRIAESVGFRSADVFRRAFERRFNTAPQHYRERFRTSEISRGSAHASHINHAPSVPRSARLG
jgi:transcriptional regulator GlxA family with amidase domain